MSLRKLCFFTMLAMAVALAALGRSHLPVQGLDLPALDSPPPHPAALLPVQSRDVDNLGAGKLLVASRELGDPNFAKTVVLLLRYDEDGVLGLILNRRTHIPLSQALEGLQAAKDRSDPIYLGGPVETSTVVALLRSPAKLEGAERIFSAVYWISSKTLFEQTISARPDPGVLRVYVGYAGWNREQLRREVKLGSWFIFPADAQTVFNTDPDSMWPQMIRKTELTLARNQPAELTPCAAALR
jgi:putative transcriptional regulator